jgi:hypothetical protein
VVEHMEPDKSGVKFGIFHFTRGSKSLESSDGRGEFTLFTAACPPALDHYATLAFPCRRHRGVHIRAILVSSYRFTYSGVTGVLIR